MDLTNSTNPASKLHQNTNESAAPSGEKNMKRSTTETKTREMEGNNTKYSLIANLLLLISALAGINRRRYRQGVLWLKSSSSLVWFGTMTIEVLSNWHLLVGQVLFGVFYRGLILCAIPWEWSLMNYAALIAPLGTAFGTHIVSKLSRHKSPFYLQSLIGAYISEFLACQPHRILSNSFLVAGVTALFSAYGSISWRREKENVSLKRKWLLTVLLAFGIFLSLCGSYVYFNASIKTEDGETVKVYNALRSFCISPVNTFELAWTGGVWEEFADKTDYYGKYRAYTVLGLEPGKEFDEVTKRYKELVGEWDPENLHEEKLEVPEDIMRYYKAYKVLHDIHMWSKYQ